LGLDFTVFNANYIPFGENNSLLKHDAINRLCLHDISGSGCGYYCGNDDVKSVAIVKNLLSYLSSNSEEHLLAERTEIDARLVMGILESVIIDKDKQAVDTRKMLARKLYSWDYLWQPSREIARSIRKGIFGCLETIGS
jgi:hypothetical protein